MRVHRMVAEQDNGSEILFTCPELGCGRQLVFKRPSGLVVLEPGDRSVRHVGGTGPVGVSVGGAALAD